MKTVEVNISLHSRLPNLPASDPERARKDTKILEAHWSAEAALGFPVSDEQKEKHRQLMALSGVVPTTGHIPAREKKP
jgi:hypothetical protein